MLFGQRLRRFGRRSLLNPEMAGREGDDRAALANILFVLRSGIRAGAAIR